MKSTRDIDRETVIRLCQGNKEALDWIQLGRMYVHEIDDLIDEENTKLARAEQVCKIGALALCLYTHPFFLKNMAVLRSAMMLNTNNYLDSVQWENSEMEWRKQFSDWARHGWIDIVLVVAEICGGYTNMRNESMELRTMSYLAHHDGDKPV